MHDHSSHVVVGLDVGGTCTNATVLDDHGRFLVDRMVEIPSRVQQGPGAAVDALDEAMAHVLSLTRVERSAVLAVGLDTPGPASATGVISSSGATNFSQPEWHGFDFRGAFADRVGLPVIYNNDGNAAALYAHEQYFGDQAAGRSSVSAIVGTGLGGGIVINGRILNGATGMGGEVGHVHIPMDGLLESDQQTPECNCGFVGDAESVASLKGIEKNLLPYWLPRFPGHPLAESGSYGKAAKQVRGYGEKGDALALKIFGQQAAAIGRLFTITANIVDPDAYFVGGGVVEAIPEFRDWFLRLVRDNTTLSEERARQIQFSLVPDRDMAGARGAALAALTAARGGLAVAV